MDSVQKLNMNKERILSTINSKGPSLPVQISREIEFSPLFTAAFLSELKAEGKVNISNMRVGSSPLYFLPGQEEQLEKFIAYLDPREKEAFELLKKNQVLEDDKQTPVVRVALRAIKDFAVPVKIRVNGESKLFWKHFSLEESDVVKFARGKRKKLGEGVIPPARPKILQKSRPEEQGDQSKEKGDDIEGCGEGEKKEKQKVLLEDKRPLAEKKKAKVQESEFGINVKDYLQAQNIEIMHVVAEKKKEFEAKIRIDTMFGKQSYYLVAKDKKNVTDNDLALALQKARGEKLPAVFMSPGELNKKGRQHLEGWGNLVKWERLRF